MTDYYLHLSFRFASSHDCLVISLEAIFKGTCNVRDSKPRPLHFLKQIATTVQWYSRELEQLHYNPVVNLKKHFMIVFFDSRVGLTRKLPILRLQGCNLRL